MIDATKEAELQDEVKHLLNDAVGTVIAKYPKASITEGKIGNYVDVRWTNGIYYQTPAEHWIVTKLCDELLGL